MESLSGCARRRPSPTTGGPRAGVRRHGMMARPALPNAAFTPGTDGTRAAVVWCGVVWCGVVWQDKIPPARPAPSSRSHRINPPPACLLQPLGLGAWLGPPSVSVSVSVSASARVLHASMQPRRAEASNAFPRPALPSPCLFCLRLVRPAATTTPAPIQNAQCWRFSGSA
jgi:hypothetical protein